MTAQACLQYMPVRDIDHAWSTLRPYQQEAATAAIAKLRDHRSTVIVLPTGCGKTRTAAYLVGRAKRGRVLWLAHRSELLSQGRETLEELTGALVGLEQAQWRAGAEQIVVASVQTLQRDRRLLQFPPDHFSLVVLDECHHGLATTFRKVVDHFTGAKLIGLTATPKRTDGKALGLRFESVAYTYSMMDAVRDGWLVPFAPKECRMRGWNLDRIETKSKRADFSDDDLEETMHDNALLEAFVDKLMEEARGRRTIAYTPRVKSAELMAEIANHRAPGCARVVSGSTDEDERRATLKAHKTGAFPYLFNCAVLTEGYDDSGVEVIANFRPTKSTNLYTQIIGRGARPLRPPTEPTAEERRAAIAESSKSHCVLLDFVGIHERHHLVDSVDVLGGNYDESVKDRARKLVAEGESVDAALLRAEREAEEAKREAARSRFKVRSSWQDRELDAFSTYHSAPPSNDSGEPADIEQLDKLRSWKFKDSEITGLTRAQAKHLLTTERMRRKNHLATYAMLRTLRRFGVTDINIGIERAGQIIQAIRDAGWRADVPEVRALLR